METNPPTQISQSRPQTCGAVLQPFPFAKQVPDFLNLKQLSPMKPITKKISTFLFLAFLTALSARSAVLFQDSTNYPYTNGPIVGQGQWYSYSPKTPGYNTYVTNNTIYLIDTTTNDAVAAPTNGWVNPTEFNFASFQLNVSALPPTANGGYFCEFQNNGDGSDVCHVFIDTRDTSVPGTYRIGIANFDTSFVTSGSEPTPVNYPMDLAPGVNYNVVILYDTNQDDLTFVGATLWINPSQQDYQNLVDAAGMGANIGDGYVFASDTTLNTNQFDIDISQIGFSPYITAGFSNVIAATTFEEVNTTNLPVFGINPESQTNYSGNSTAFYAVASAVDATYQWYSSEGALTDGANVVGSTNDALTLNNLSVSDYYYAIVTDAYGNKATSAIATNTVITTPTAPFFTNTTPLNVTNNLFSQVGFTNLAFGTGPLTYQWYFAPSNAPTSFSPLSGQTSPTLFVVLADPSEAGNYFVTASNTVGGGSIAIGPTNSITELPPLFATIQQLHQFLLATTNELTTNAFYNINTNNVIVTGTVAVFNGYGSSYSEYWIEDAAGNGVRVFFGGHGNTNTPPIGTSLTISAPVQVYSAALEIDPTGYASFTTNSGPPVAICPKIENNNFLNLATNPIGANALNLSDSEITFTNCYLYGNSFGGSFGTNGTGSGVGGVFATGRSTILYFTVGSPYGVPPSNTNTLEIFEPGNSIGTNGNAFYGQPIPTFCHQLTGIYEGFFTGGHVVPELATLRLADFVGNLPPAFSTTITQNKGVPTLNWGPVQAGSTYTANTATSINGPWTPAQEGLAYYPTNGTFTDTNLVPTKFYLISSP